MHPGPVVHGQQSNKIVNGLVVTVSLAVGFATLYYLYHQTVLLKHQIKRHEKDPDVKPD